MDGDERTTAARDRPDLVVFDVVETLADLAPVADRLGEVGEDPGLLTLWFTRLVRDAVALTVAGGWAPFAEVAASALRASTAGRLDDARVAHVVGGFAATVPQPDAVAGVRAAAERFRVVALSNGSAANTRGFLERCGLLGEVEQVLSIDEVRAWKPDRRVYEHALRATGVPAARAAMVAVHSWDLAGARAAGMTTGWCSRLEGEPVAVFGEPDVRADRLDELVSRLAAMPAT